MSGAPTTIVAKSATGPLARMRQQWWLKLLLAGLALAYGVYVFRTFARNGLFEYIGLDYRAFRSSGEIARALGFAQVYDLATQADFQQPLYDAYSYGFWRIPFAPTPTPYLPAFVVPFLVLPVWAPIPGFVFWTVLNLAVLLAYLPRVLPRDGRALAAAEALLCLPVFLNLVFGQVNVWLFICVGEFLRASARGRALRSGLWLGGLLLKPQMLVVLLPGLLIARRFRILAGCGLAAVAIMAVSVALAGVQGIVNLVRLVRLYPGDLPTTFPESMMNWRALTINHALYLSPVMAWQLAMAGLAMTVVLALALWVVPAPPESPQFALVTLGTLAATCAISWHSHVHMALPLLVPLLLVAPHWQPRRWLLHLWVLVPSLLFVEEAFRLGPRRAHVVASLAVLAVNSVVLGWVTKTLWSPATGQAVPDAAATEPPAAARSLDRLWVDR